MAMSYARVCLNIVRNLPECYHGYQSEPAPLYGIHSTPSVTQMADLQLERTQ